jgi:hypothetical protein
MKHLSYSNLRNLWIVQCNGKVVVLIRSRKESHRLNDRGQRDVIQSTIKEVNFLESPQVQQPFNLKFQIKQSNASIFY